MNILESSLLVVFHPAKVRFSLGGSRSQRWNIILAETFVCVYNSTQRHPWITFKTFMKVRLPSYSHSRCSQLRTSFMCVMSLILVHMRDLSSVKCELRQYYSMYDANQGWQKPLSISKWFLVWPKTTEKPPKTTEKPPKNHYEKPLRLKMPSKCFHVETVLPYT
jgi:hypothetical protein